MGALDRNDNVLEELKSQNIDGLTERGKLAIRELADMNEGAVIFLILSLNLRIRELENALCIHKPLSVVH